MESTNLIYSNKYINYAFKSLKAIVSIFSNTIWTLSPPISENAVGHKVSIL